MWRLWTKGWGVRAWWYAVKEATPRKLAWMLPRQVALWAFIRVYSASIDSPSRDYVRACDGWSQGNGR